ncbi:MAG: hypothetical protein RLZZ450_7700 [Pseudomonadota bacterium]
MPARRAPETKRALPRAVPPAALRRERSLEPDSIRRPSVRLPKNPRVNDDPGRRPFIVRLARRRACPERESRADGRRSAPTLTAWRDLVNRREIDPTVGARGPESACVGVFEPRSQAGACVRVSARSEGPAAGDSPRFWRLPPRSWAQSQAPDRSGKVTLAIPLRGLGMGHERSSSAMQSNCSGGGCRAAERPAARTRPLRET